MSCLVCYYTEPLARCRSVDTGPLSGCGSECRLGAFAMLIRRRCGGGRAGRGRGFLCGGVGRYTLQFTACSLRLIPYLASSAGPLHAGGMALYCCSYAICGVLGTHL
jgi:hypothetical protein